VLSRRSLQSAFTKIDAFDGNQSIRSGPFSVFSICQTSGSPANERDLSRELTDDEDAGDVGDGGEIENVEDIDGGDVEGGSVEEEEVTEEEVAEDDVLRNYATQDAQLFMAYDDPSYFTPGEDIITDNDVDSNNSTTTNIIAMKQRIQPYLVPYLTSASSEERQLLHYWITNLSGMMIPTQRRDNPFQTIYIPLALSVPDGGGLLSANAALLHSIYALSAFNRAQISPVSDHFLSVGKKHHQISLQCLQRNVIETAANQREALLATIITMSSIEVITGGSSSWRTHIAGGRIWLNAIGEKGWVDNSSTNILCQIFLCLEALGCDGRRAGGFPSVRIESLRPLPSHDQVVALEEDKIGDYALDKIFGITEPVFHALIRINQLCRYGYTATTEEIDLLGRHIRLSDPDSSTIESSVSYDELTHHHACAFYCACLIHFHRTLKHTAPARLYHLVRRGLYHLWVIDRLEANMNVSGLLWPVFITACEVEVTSGLRDKAIRLFDKGLSHGIGNMCSAAMVVREVWRRRDESAPGIDVTWRAVMDDLGIDILLA
jgi:hypothetical protein